VPDHRLTSWRAYALRVLIALGVTSAITGCTFAGAFWYANKKVNEIDRVNLERTTLDEEPPGEPANFLIVGSDTRDFAQTEEDARAFGSSAETGGQRSDTIMVVHVDPGARSGMVLSFPRDLWVDVEGLGEAKINAAYNQGPNNLILTIAKNFDIPIHHYLEVNFASFRKIVDAIGGVHIYFPAPARDAYTGLNIPFGGCAPLAGDQALAFVRSRHYESFQSTGENGRGTWHEDQRQDIGRIARQQYFMRTVAQEALGKARRNPLTAKRLLDNTVPYLKADRKLNLADLQHLATTFKNLDPQRVPMETMPFTIGRARGQSVLFVDKEKAAPLLARMRSFAPIQQDRAPKEPPDVSPADVSVRVLNGSGQSGVAGDAYGALKDLRFQVVGQPSDAPSFDHDVTEIRYEPSHRGAAELVLWYLGGRGKIVAAPDVTDVNVEVVVGKDYVGVGSEAGTSTSSTTSTSTTQPPFIGEPLPGLPPAQSGEPGLPLVGCPAGS
jgi:LCP family protein required for cell wall assembly